ncbi:MAG TPA: hypothetical protein VH414_17985 [Lichenihabitans sp.]|jgi:hypothetical protein|nr:hypothetical protein [Lichenihabitans sp.]
MKILMVGVVLILAIMGAAGVAVWTHLPKSECVQNCCDNQSCTTPAAPKP